jgi:hypothetical protein
MERYFQHARVLTMVVNKLLNITHNLRETLVGFRCKVDGVGAVMINGRWLRVKDEWNGQ